jgi:phage gpG-like protein
MLNVEIEGLDALEERFVTLPGAIREALSHKIEDLAQRLEQRVKDNLSGAVLQAKSGALRDSIEMRLEPSAAALVARTKYAAAQEYGFVGEESVCADSREIREAFGRAIAPKTVFVRAFSRAMDLPERSYMRSAFDEMQDEIAAALSSALSARTESFER